MNPSQNLGKSTEMLVASMLLAQNRELYLPCVDDHGVDMLVRTKNFQKEGDYSKPENFEFQEIQIKSVSKGGLFAAISLDPRPNYWFIFYIQNIDKMWVINSMDIANYKDINGNSKPGDTNYIAASQNHTGSNIGKWSIDLTPTKKNPIKSEEYLIKDFSKLP